MTDYRVMWEIDIEAESPLEALQKAREIQQDPDNVSDVFQVRNKRTHLSVTMDCAGNSYPSITQDTFNQPEKFEE